MTGKKKQQQNKEIKTYRLTGPPTNIEQYFDWTVVDLVLVVDIESWKLPLEANNIILISYRRLNFMCLMLTILFTIFDITWFLELYQKCKILNQLKISKEIKTTGVFKDTKGAKSNWCIPRYSWIKGLQTTMSISGYSWIKGLQTTAVIQDTSESKGCQSVVYSRILNQRVTNN